MILELEEVEKLIEKELEFAKTANPQMAMGMLRIKELIVKEETKKADFLKSLTLAEEIERPFIDFSRVYK